ncbi:hypothetical protein [Mucilaginibacter sp. UYCu711]|uniref:hypothetical protein n=1 Tax=Mucilaginibacter sp. UYCu711 TaxID=3156339 RepID=UPI003D253621
MKRSIFLCALFFLLISVAQAQKHSVDFYKETYRRGFVTLHSDTIPYQKTFFNEFPSNFKELKKLYGWTEQTTYGRTLTYVPPYYFTRFFEIRCVSHKALTKKIIDVSVNGVWVADAIALFQRAATNYAIAYNKEFIKELQTRSKADAISVWAFYCDYESPYYRKEAYDKLVKATAPNNKKMVELITAGYKKAATRWKKH